jgi:CheY-like chemotaxis protein
MNCASPIGRPEPDRRTVLLVEPDVLLRVLVSEVLRQQGLNVAAARNADEALSIVQSGFVVDLLVSETDPPTVSPAASLPATVRAQYPEIKIVVASGDVAHGEPRENMDAFLPKPYDLGRLVRLIKSLLGG